MVLVVYGPADAQRPTGKTRIGWLSAVGESSSSTGQQEIIRILREFGYVDGKNIQFEFRYAQTSSIACLMCSLHQARPAPWLYVKPNITGLA